MRKGYVKPSFQPIELKQRVLQLQQGSRTDVHVGGTGPLDAKACSFDAFEDEYGDQ